MTTDTGAFVWYELVTPDADAAKAFYGAVVGLGIALPRPMAMAAWTTA